MNKRKFVVIVIAMTAVTVIIAISVVIAVRRPQDQIFDTILWNEYPEKRIGMISSVYHLRIVGRTKKEVIELLGEPTLPGTVSDQRLIYWLGGDSLIDDWWLEVRFANNISVSLRHYPD